MKVILMVLLMMLLVVSAMAQEPTLILTPEDIQYQFWGEGWFGTATDRSVSVGILGWFTALTATAPFTIILTAKKPVINISFEKPSLNINMTKPMIKVSAK